MLQEKTQGVPPQEEETITSISIPNTQIIDSTVFYVVNVTGKFNHWSVSKRYSQFEELHNALLEELAVIELPKGIALPPKKYKLFSDHLSPAFIDERRTLLENYLKKLLTVKELANMKNLMAFCTSDRTVFYDGEEEKDSSLPDDVEVTGVAIPATRTMSDHVLYQVELTNARKRKSFQKWTVLKRFGQFFDMDTALRTAFANDAEALAILPYPPERKSKLFVDHMTPAFVEERRALLEHYMKRLVKIEKVVRNSDFLQFIGVKIE